MACCRCACHNYGGCLLAFTNPLRAADYASVVMPKQTFAYFCSSPKQVVLGVKELHERAGVRYIALDRCPRCNVFTTVDASNFDNAAKVICCGTFPKRRKSPAVACTGTCRSAARSGEFLCARDVGSNWLGTSRQKTRAAICSWASSPCNSTTNGSCVKPRNSWLS